MQYRRALGRLAAITLLAFLLVATAALAATWFWTRAPGSDHRGPLPPLTAEQQRLAADLQSTVHLLAQEIGPRHYREPLSYRRAADALEARLQAMGYDVRREPVPARGASYPNLIVERRGTARPKEIVLVGAHYDSYGPGPGADDNASGAAAALEVARHFAHATPARTLRVVLFANEEPPFFQTDEMGSLTHAAGARARGEQIVIMFSLEMLGSYDDDPGSQRYPSPLDLFYPDQGDFVAFVGRIGQGQAADRSIEVFRRTTAFPSEAFAGPEGFPGVGLSDHWSFWQHGYPAVMVTDTAFFRNPRYHTPQDTAASLDYECMARVVEGVRRIVAWWLQQDQARTVQ